MFQQNYLFNYSLTMQKMLPFQTIPIMQRGIYSVSGRKKENIKKSFQSSTLTKGVKEYEYDTNKFLSEPKDFAEPFVPKKEYTPEGYGFDPNIR